VPRRVTPIVDSELAMPVSVTHAVDREAGTSAPPAWWATTGSSGAHPGAPAGAAAAPGTGARTASDANAAGTIARLIDRRVTRTGAARASAGSAGPTRCGRAA
jgi:hypothetical protein